MAGLCDMDLVPLIGTGELIDFIDGCPAKLLKEQSKFN